jgi:hypothetical protein
MGSQYIFVCNLDRYQWVRESMHAVMSTTLKLASGSIQLSYLDGDPYRRIPLVLDRYFQLLRELYECGARRFILLNVPPTNRTPSMLSRSSSHRDVLRKVIHSFNHQLQCAVFQWSRQHPDVSSRFFPYVYSYLTWDSWWLSTDVYGTIWCVVIHVRCSRQSQRVRIHEQYLHRQWMRLVGRLPP